MAEPLRLRFLRSASAVGQLGEAEAELAMVGRSNVGKSSLINALANQNALARTSKTPGATRLLNVFELDPPGSGLWLVDLPGYGYARAPKNERRSWRAMIEGYLTERETLLGAVLLIDGEIGPTPLDVGTVEWLRHIGLDVIPVATKADKVKSARRQKRKMELAAGLGVERAQVSWVSAAKGQGIPELRRRLTEALRG